MKEHNGELDIMRSDLTDGAIWWAVRHNENMVTERWPLTENSIRQLEKMRAANLREIERSTADDAQLPEGGIMTIDRDALAEKAAQAIFDVRDDEFDLDEWEDIDSGDRERYICDARAVLDAILPKVQAQTIEEAIKMLEADGYFCPAIEQRAAEYRKAASE